MKKKSMYQYIDKSEPKLKAKTIRLNEASWNRVQALAKKYGISMNLAVALALEKTCDEEDTALKTLKK